MRGDHKGPEELKREVMEDMKGGGKSEDPMLGIVSRLATLVKHQEKLLSSVSTMTISLAREEYAKNLLSLEQVGQFPALVEVNEKLLTQMAELLTNQTFMEHPEMRKVPRKEIVQGLKRSIHRGVEEYLRGMPNEG